MPKFKVSVEVTGYSRGWMSAIVEAETAEDAKEMARDDAEWGPVETVRDDREADWEWIKVEPYKEPPPGTRIELPPAPPGTKAVVLFVDEAMAEQLRQSLRVSVSIGSSAAATIAMVSPRDSCTSG